MKKTRITLHGDEIDILIDALRKHALELQSMALNPLATTQEVDKAKTAYSLLIKLEKRK